MRLYLPGRFQRLALYPFCRGSATAMLVCTCSTSSILDGTMGHNHVEERKALQLGELSNIDWSLDCLLGLNGL